MRRCPFLMVCAPIIAMLGLIAPAQSAPIPEPAKLEKLPYSGGVLVARGLRNGTIHLPATNAPHGVEIIFPALNCAPAPCALPNVEASTGAVAPVNETPIAVNPLNSNEMIAGGNDFDCIGGSYRGFWVSNDGGKKWSGGCGVDLRSTAGEGDPIVGYDLKGNVYQGGIEVPASGAEIGIASSSNNGATWNPMVVATQVSGQAADKPWLQIDTNPNSPDKNTLYISSTMFASNGNSTIYVSHSTDGGLTWKSVAASPLAVYPAINQFSDLNTGSDGTIYLTYINCTANSPQNDCGGTTAKLYVQKSTDAGNTWSRHVAIGSVALAPDACNCAFYGSLPNTNERISEIPVIGVDNSGGTRNGQLYVVEYNWTGAFAQVQVASSTDGGKTWSAPVAMAPRSDTHDQFFPWLNVDAKGNVGVTWLDRRNDPNNLDYEAFATWSADGGSTFKTNVQIADTPSNPLDDGYGGGFMGDYTGNAWFGKFLYTSWTDTRNGSYSLDEVGGLKR